MEDEMFNDDEQGSEQAATGDDGGRRHGENTDDEEGAEPGRCPDEIKDAAPQRENEEKPTGWLQGARNKDWKSAGGRVLHEAGAACMKERGQKSKKVRGCRGD